MLATIPQALEDLRQGKMVILVDDEDRENEGDLVIAAEFIDTQAVNFMAKYARGLICLSMTGEQLDKLELPMMTNYNRSSFNTAFTISIEAAQGVTTGISAADRAHTIQVAINEHSTKHDIVSPGHIFPLRAKDGGVLVRGGQTEGSVDLARLAGLKPAAVICEIMNDDGSMARMPDLEIFAAEHQLKIISVADLIAYRLQKEYLVELVAESRLPLENLGEFTIKVFQEKLSAKEHVVLQKGEISPEKPMLVRVHSECFTGDIFHSERCDCGWQLHSAMQIIAEQGGILVYMQQEGRDIGLANKIKAYALQDQGYDTVEANQKLGFHPDQRDYGIGSQILRYLNVKQIRLLTNNPNKVYSLKGYGLEIIERVEIESEPNTENLNYLKTKRDKMGHLLTKLG
jgi:3,4-dihydroxy 2-butanone 4-phosphate synthase/GTP cyclohydrolase II